MMRPNYRGNAVQLKEGPLNSRENRSFTELLDIIIWNQFGYRVKGGSFYKGDLHVGFDTGCSVSWQKNVANAIMKEFRIDRVYVDGILFEA